MTHRRGQLLCSALIMLMVCPHAVGESELTSQEVKDRRVDQVALAAQDRAINKLTLLAPRFEKSDRLEGVLARLVEANQQAAKIEFRLAHGRAQLANREVDLSRYESRLRSVAAAASLLIARFPESEEIDSIYLSRAHAYKELKQKVLAEQDFGFVANHSPQTDASTQANLNLGELATEDGKYRKAIAYLEEIEAMPADEHYPFALYQMAWAYFNLDDIPTAITYLRRQVDYYRKKAKNADSSLSVSDQAFQEQSLRDLVAFYFSRYEKNDPQFPIATALQTFREWEPGPYLGRMMVHFSGLLRSRNRLDGLENWKSQVVRQESRRPETLEVVTSYFEYVAEKKLLGPLRAAQTDFNRLSEANGPELRKAAVYSSILNRILQTAAGLQNLVTQKLKADEASELRKLLATVYSTFVDLSTDQDPKVVQARYNLAEIFFAEKDFETAARQYHWLMVNGGKTCPLDPPAASLRAIVSLYQSLRAKDILPKDLRAVTPAGSRSPDTGALKSQLGEWVDGILTHLTDFGRTPAGFETYEYEAYRILYADGQTRAAVEGMQDMVEARPSSPISLPAANLVLDSYLLEKNWERTLKTVERFQKCPALGDTAFRNRIRDLPNEVAFRLIENTVAAGEDDKVVTLSKDYLQRYGNSRWTPHVLWLASRTATKKGDLSTARLWLSNLLNRFPRAEHRALALLARAELFEKLYDFDSATKDYEAFLSDAGLSKNINEDHHVDQRFFFTAWLAKKPPLLDCSRYADEPINRECDRYHGLLAWATSVTESKAVDKALKGYAENGPIWAAVSLRAEPKDLPLEKRIRLAKTLAKHWKDADPLIQFVLIPALNRTLPETFAVSQRALPRLAPLKPKTRAIVRRIALVREVEEAAGEVMDVPWAQVKISVLDSVGELYRDFTEELSRLPAPKGLSPEELESYQSSVSEILAPFQEKWKTIRTQVKELAAKSAVNPAAVTGLSKDFSRNVASKTDEVTWIRDFLKGPAEPDTAARDRNDSAQELRRMWAEALQEKAWARLAYFFQELKEKAKLPETTLNVMQAVALFRAGAQAEAIAELEANKSGLEPSQRYLADKLLAAWYASSTLLDKAKTLEMALQQTREERTWKR